MAVEFCLLEPDAKMFGRLLVYLGQLWLEERPNGEAGRRYQVGTVAVNLTGRGRTARDMRLTGAGSSYWPGSGETNVHASNRATAR